jgi:hypothetical protein
MITEITKAQLLCLRLGQLKDEGKARPRQISMAKMNNVSNALKIARLACDILGANGIIDESGHSPHAESRDRQHVRGDGRHPLRPNMGFYPRYDFLYFITEWPLGVGRSAAVSYLIFPKQLFELADFDARAKVYTDFLKVILEEDLGMIRSLHRE